MDQVYFIGIGGIGMSAIARYFKAKGFSVAGYDLTPSPLTRALEQEGMPVCYSDEVEAIPASCRSAKTMVVYTPAVPESHRQLRYYHELGARVLKRSEILGEITRMARALCVAGTHGKTSTSTLLAHLLHQSHVGCSAFLGGISNNYETNLLLSEHSPWVVIEADEFDRSFHRLSPEMAIITSADPDHLDIYGTAEAYRESFEHFTSLISPSGVLVMRQGIPVSPRLAAGARLYTYDVEQRADFYASNIEVREAKLYFDWHYPAVGDAPEGVMRVELGVPLRVNVGNATAAMALAYLSGARLDELAEGVCSWRGVHRRFDRVVDSAHCVLIDDYAHHPVELEASIASVRALYPERRLVGVFQPHLYSRTKDFYQEFAHSLDGLDELILLDIYPARELPIEGVSSAMIAREMKHCPVQLMTKEAFLPYLQSLEQLPEVMLMVGAGDIDRLVAPAAELIRQRL